jgi:hypothetical protein
VVELAVSFENSRRQMADHPETVMTVPEAMAGLRSRLHE